MAELNYQGYEGDIIQDVTEIEPQSPELIDRIVELAISQLREGAAFALGGGFIYDRNGRLNSDQLGTPPNSYRNSWDPAVLQISIEIPAHVIQPIDEALTEERIARERAAAAAKRQEIDAEIARLQGIRDAL